MGTFMMTNDKKCQKIKVNNSENKQHMGLKFCLPQLVMEANPFMEYRKNLRISILFCVDLIWIYPPTALTPDEVRTMPFSSSHNPSRGTIWYNLVSRVVLFPVQHVMSQLPRPLTQSELILSSVEVSHRETFQTLLQQLDHHKIYQALLWLSANNPLYQSQMNQSQPQMNQNLTSMTCASSIKRIL
jgi:hypothetical protein